MEASKATRNGAHFSSLLSVFLAACLWGSLGIFGQSLYEYGLTPMVVVTGKNLVGAIGLGVVSLFIKGSSLRVDRHVIPLLALNAFISFSLLNFAYFTTVLLAGAGIAALLLYTAPVFAALLARLFLREALSSERVLALMLVIAGLLLMAARPGVPGFLPTKALATGLFSGLAWAFYTVFTKPLLRTVPSLPLLCYLFGFGSLFLFLFNPAAVLQLHLPPRGWLLLVTLGLVPTAGAYLLYNRGLAKLDATVASIVATIEPVSAILQESFFLGRVFDRMEIMGAGLIIAGALAAQLRGLPLSKSK